ncbi:MAG: STAS domain-containing protein [bacterium]
MLIKVDGFVDTITVGKLEQVLDSILKSKCYKIIVDLANVDYISSAGWSALLSKIKEIREKGGDLKLLSLQPDVHEVFELLELDYILKSFNNLEAAVSDFELSPAFEINKQIN